MPVTTKLSGQRGGGPAGQAFWLTPRDQRLNFLCAFGGADVGRDRHQVARGQRGLGRAGRLLRLGDAQVAQARELGFGNRREGREIAHAVIADDGGSKRLVGHQHAPRQAGVGRVPLPIGAAVGRRRFPPLHVLVGDGRFAVADRAVAEPLPRRRRIFVAERDATVGRLGRAAQLIGLAFGDQQIDGAGFEPVDRRAHGRQRTVIDEFADVDLLAQKRDQQRGRAPALRQLRHRAGLASGKHRQRFRVLRGARRRHGESGEQGRRQRSEQPAARARTSKPSKRRQNRPHLLRLA